MGRICKNRRSFVAGLAVGAAAPLLSVWGVAYSWMVLSGVRSPRFLPFGIPELEERPDFWKVSIGKITEICSKASRCARKEIIYHTPLGYPVYAPFCGDGFDDSPPQTNWSAGSVSTPYRNYMESLPPAWQTFLLQTDVHGAEPECAAGAMNLIQAFETGRDFRGKEHSELADLISKYRFIIVPCLNMDGVSGTIVVAFLFNRTGKVGGRIVFRLCDTEGDALSREVAENVTPQGGVFPQKQL